MSRSQMAARMGVTPARIGQIESAEQTNRLKIDTLARAAEAMNCTLVYAIVPNAGSYDATITDQANEKAGALMQRVEHTMALENQLPSNVASARISQELIDEYAASGRLWEL